MKAFYWMILVADTLVGASAWLSSEPYHKIRSLPARAFDDRLGVWQNGRKLTLAVSFQNQEPTTVTSTTSSRRNFGKALLLAVAATATTTALPAHAIPMITTNEFIIILRDSARSIARVEFAGAQNDQVQVILSDGTRFGLSDVVESPVDPRSPLKIAALCRENGVPTQFVSIQAALAKAPKRTKNYANSRVQEAAQKEKEKMARMQQDEQERLEALAQMQANSNEQQNAAATTSAATEAMQ